MPISGNPKPDSSTGSSEQYQRNFINAATNRMVRQTLLDGMPTHEDPSSNQSNGSMQDTTFSGWMQSATPHNVPSNEPNIDSLQGLAQSQDAITTGADENSTLNGLAMTDDWRGKHKPRNFQINKSY